jgi:hypothetical protein
MRDIKCDLSSRTGRRVQGDIQGKSVQRLHSCTALRTSAATGISGFDAPHRSLQGCNVLPSVLSGILIHLPISQPSPFQPSSPTPHLGGRSPPHPSSHEIDKLPETNKSRYLRRRQRLLIRRPLINLLDSLRHAMPLPRSNILSKFEP